MLEDDKDGSDLDFGQVLKRSYDYDDKGLRVIPLGSLVPKDYDYIAVASDSTHDIYQYKLGGASGTLLATVTLTYTDSSKNQLVSIART